MHKTTNTLTTTSINQVADKKLMLVKAMLVKSSTCMYILKINVFYLCSHCYLMIMHEGTLNNYFPVRIYTIKIIMKCHSNLFMNFVTAIHLQNLLTTVPLGALQIVYRAHPSSSLVVSCVLPSSACQPQG